ncbi:outer membrane beta-barrel protein [Pedobacter sp. GR22-10]|nr:outer membrane beta-barrel protein [Pedobacter sp. GR22-10]MCX2429595.1 outer membrane beta-barrel protein [Pedobacter sp. GR22-10]
MKNCQILIMLLCLLYGTQVLAQQSCEVKGTAIDSLKKSIGNLTVKFYSENDSLSTFTTANGQFSFAKVTGKEFTINIGGIGYRTLIMQYKIPKDAQQIDLGKLQLKGGAINLDDVVIKAKPIAIKYKQDTVEYDANAFNVQDDDRVTDLLKQLPGIEVDENDNVSAMGKSMTKLRVNGEDFFTNNVKDFISQLPAGIVAKIQVIEDFGDQANFTGIKTGDAQKMLNIVTKPEMDNGQFGNAYLNGGTNKQIGGNLNGNFWKSSKQISVNTGYNIADNGAGLSQSRNAAVNINNKINKTMRFGASYGYTKNDNNSSSTQIVETVNNLGKLNSQLQNTNFASNGGHRLGLTLNRTNKDIYIFGSGSFINNNNETISNSLNNQSGFIRQDFKNNSVNSSSSPNLNASLEISKKFRKNTLSGNFAFSNSSNRSRQDLITNTLYYRPDGGLEKDSLLNRNVYNTGNNKRINLGISYSFLLANDTVSLKSLSFNYNGSANVSQNDLQTFVFNPATQSSTRVDSLSIFTKNNTFNQSLNLNYQQSGKKTRLNMGINISPNVVRNNYPELNATYKNTFFNISPNINYNRNISSSKSVSFSYNGRNSNPSIFQMQPVKNTQNLQNIIIGNPNLESSFNHSFSSNFNYFDKKSNISFQSGLGINTISNEIINNIILIPDTLGAYKQETRFENVNGNYGVNGNYNLNIPFKERKYAISLSGSVGTSRKIAIINNNKTANTGTNFSQNISSSINLKKFTANMGITYSVSANNNNNENFGQFSVPEQTPYNLLLNTGQSFFSTKSFNSNLSASLRLKNFRFSFNGNFSASHNNNIDDNNPFNVNTKTQSLNFGTSGNGNLFKSWNFNYSANKRINKGYNLANINPLIVNLGFGKSFLKNKVLSCSVNVNDLLNEGNNISQRVLGNSIIESRNNQVMRIITFALSYNLSDFGGKSFKLRSN